MHQHHVADVGQDVGEHARGMAGPNRLSRQHILARAVLHVFGTHQAVNAGPADQAQNDDHRPHPAAQGACQWARLEHRRQGEHQQDVGYRRKHVVDPLLKITHRAAKVAADGAENSPYQRRKQRCRQAHGNGHLCTLDDFAQHVTPQLVAAKWQGV